MRIVTSILGYIIAALAIPVAVATFVTMQYTGRLLIDTTGLTVSPWIIGGGVVQTVSHSGYKTDIHKPVFRGLLFDRDKGFVQIDWKILGRTPEMIVEEIDFNQDGQNDFRLEFQTGSKKIAVAAHNPDVLNETDVFDREKGYTVRVWLANSSQ